MLKKKAKINRIYLELKEIINKSKFIYIKIFKKIFFFLKF